MPRPRSSMPAYRFHVSGQAVVTLAGKDFYLGPHDSPESRARYFELVQEYNANGKIAPDKPTDQKEQAITVRTVTGEYRESIKKRYANSYRERKRHEGLCTTLEDEYGHLAADEFGPRKLAELRDLFVASGNCRTYVNRLVRQLKGIFRHAVSRELIDVSVVVRLDTLEPLRRGQTQAKEPVKPVDLEVVRSTAEHLSPIIKAMVELQAATGMRPSEVCNLRPCDIQHRDDGAFSLSERQTALPASAVRPVSLACFSVVTTQKPKWESRNGPLSSEGFRVVCNLLAHTDATSPLASASDTELYVIDLDLRGDPSPSAYRTTNAILYREEDTTHYWTPEELNQWALIEYRFELPGPIDSVVEFGSLMWVYNEHYYPVFDPLAQGTLEVSRDGENWHVLYHSQSGMPLTDGRPSVLPLLKAASVVYLRARLFSSTHGKQVCFSQFLRRSKKEQPHRLQFLLQSGSGEPAEVSLEK